MANSCNSRLNRKVLSYFLSLLSYAEFSIRRLAYLNNAEIKNLPLLDNKGRFVIRLREGI